jgi:hypothetical protein
MERTYKAYIKQIFGFYTDRVLRILAKPDISVTKILYALLEA